MLQAENILFTIVLVLYLLTMLLYFLYVILKRESVARLALLAQIVGLVLHTATLAVRGAAIGRLPLTTQYEFASSFAWGLCLVSLIFILKFKFHVLGAFTTPVMILIIGFAALRSREVSAMPDALKSGWLGVHVSTAIISYGAFGVAFVLALILLLRERVKQGGFWDNHLPAAEKLDLLGYRSVCLGLLFLTFTIVTGAIWAEYSWGSYWSWDPKETWSLVTWLIYAIYLHLRILRGWKGKRAAYFAVAGFACVLFTYVGVNFLHAGLHNYASNPALKP